MESPRPDELANEELLKEEFWYEFMNIIMFGKLFTSPV